MKNFFSTYNSIFYFILLTFVGCGNGGGNFEEAESKSKDSNVIVAAPSGITTVSSSPGADVTPTINVSGVIAGHTINLYSDSSCTDQVGSLLATGTSVDITTNTLSSGGIYTFYANATAPGSSSSNCSTENASYTLNPCPTDWIEVPGNATYSTNNFCVMKYEAKNVGGVPTSQATLSPWVNINQINASTNCRGLGAKYDLISNPEWMTIARNIESQDTNWSGGSVGSGCIFRGNSNLNDACGYDGANPESGTGRNSKASHTLSNGQVIWDFAGNVWSLVDWTKGDPLTGLTPANKAYFSGDGAPVGGTWREWTLIDVNINNGDEMESKTWQSLDPTLNSTNGIGSYYSGSITQGGVAARGGSQNSLHNAGIYAFLGWMNSSDPHSVVGFLCVLRAFD